MQNMGGNGCSTLVVSKIEARTSTNNPKTQNTLNHSQDCCTFVYFKLKLMFLQKNCTDFAKIAIWKYFQKRLFEILGTTFVVPSFPLDLIHCTPSLTLPNLPTPTSALSSKYLPSKSQLKKHTGHITATSATSHMKQPNV